MREYEKENALRKNALLVFLSLVLILLSGMKVAQAQQVIFVDQKQRFWTDSVKTITEGIEKAQKANCTEIWVAAGTYRERIKLSPGICIYGGFTGEEVVGGNQTRKEVRDNRDILTNVTVIDAELKGTAVTGASGAVIDGFMIKNGKAAQGGGILCNESNPYAGATVTIMNCTITGNEATTGNGGGIYLCNYKPIIINCEIVENDAPRGAGGGIALLSTMDGLIKNNEIQRNISSKGAGLYINSAGAQVEIRNNLITRNSATTGSGGGLYMERCSTPLVSNNIIAQNQAVTGGGGIYLWGSHPVIINDTIAENYATMNAYSELLCDLSQPAITNSIVWSIGGGEAVYSPYPMTKVTYSDISNLGSIEIEGANTNISQDPKFKDTLYHLQTGIDGSVCIDAGDPASSLDRDLSRNDMGAYGGQNAGKVGCDYAFPVIDVKLDPIPGIEANNIEGTMTWFKVVPIYPDNSLGIYLNDVLIVELKDNDGLPPKVVITDSIGIPLDPNTISLANGKNVLTIKATDGFGHQAVRSINIDVVDTTPPEIICPAGITVEAEGPEGVAATSAAIQAFLKGATATDIVDGSVTPTTDAPQMLKVGKTIVTFTATDKAGQSSTCQATVSVVDTTSPVISCPDAITVEAEGPEGVAATSAAIQAFLKGATATDIVDGSVTPTYEAPEMFKVGKTVVTFTATDKAGKSSTCSAAVTVVDTTPPAMSCPDGITVEAEGADGVSANNEAIQAFLNGATATDIVDGAVTPVANAPAVFGIGQTVVTFTATDKAGNSNTCSATVIVEDTTAPVITSCPQSITVKAESPRGAAIDSAAIQAFLNSFTATDVVGVNLTNDAPAIFPVGDTVVTFTAIDSANHTSTCKATVTVMRTGDINGDGKLSAADALSVFQCYLEEGPCNQGCDVDGDGRISAKDALCVFLKYLGEPSCLD
ncbi:MAG: HYR domain-containing protein [bacterium]